jgi:hypothetical protein
MSVILYGALLPPRVRERCPWSTLSKHYQEL